MSNLIKRNNMTLSTPKMIIVEPPPVLTENFTAQEVESVNDITGIHAQCSRGEEKHFLTDRVAELQAELRALQTEISQQLEVLHSEAEAMRQEAEQDCRQLMEQTQQEIDMMKAQALEECMAIQTETYEKAYQEGLRQAQEDIENDRQLALTQVKQILEAAEVKRLEIIRTAEPAIVDLSVAVAQKIIIAELSSRPELIIDIVKEAIDHLDNPQNVRVLVNPKDELYLSGQSQFLTSNQYGNVSLTIAPDESIERGGCIVESNMAVVDSRLGIRVDNIQNTLNEVLINEGSI